MILRQNSAMAAGLVPAKLDFDGETPYSASYDDVSHSADDLRVLHERYPELRSEAAALQSAWPPLVSGAHRLEFAGVVLSLFFGDVAMLRELSLAADAIYLDGFAPAKNPEMWTHQAMRSVARLCAPHASVATWSVAGAVRD